MWRVSFSLGRSAFEGRVEAPPTVDGFGAGGLGSVLSQLLATQGAAEAGVRRLVLLIERHCRETGGEEGH